MNAQNIFQSVNSNVLKAEVKILTGNVLLTGELAIPENSKCVVLFVHGSGSTRHSARNLYLTSVFNSTGIGTLLFDLLTDEEEEIDKHTNQLRFDINLLAERFIHVTRWVVDNPGTHDLNIGYFATNTDVAAALVAAAVLGKQVGAIVLRSGRADLAEEVLPELKSPTLLIVGDFDNAAIEINHQALGLLKCEKMMEIIHAASHLFEEPGKLEEVAKISSNWFIKKLQ